MLALCPQHVLCDLDGTLIDNEKLKCEAWRRAIGDIVDSEPDPVQHEAVYAQMVGLEKHQIALSLAQYYGIVGQEKQLVERRDQHKETLYSSPDGLARLAFQPLIAFVQRIREGFALVQEGTISLVSSASEQSVALILGALEIETLFDHRICGRVKTPENPECYWSVLTLLQAVPEECLGIEDSIIGYQAARTVGIPCLLVPNSFTKLSRVVQSRDSDE